MPYVKVRDAGSPEGDNGISWNPEDMPELEGVLMGTETNVGVYNQTVYRMKVGERNYSVWGSAVLRKKLTGIPPGSQIKIVYLGRKANKKGTSRYKDYDVFVFEGDTNNPAPPPAWAQPAQPPPTQPVRTEPKEQLAHPSPTPPNNTIPEPDKPPF